MSRPSDQQYLEEYLTTMRLRLVNIEKEVEHAENLLQALGDGKIKWTVHKAKRVRGTLDYDTEVIECNTFDDALDLIRRYEYANVVPVILE